MKKIIITCLLSLCIHGVCLADMAIWDSGQEVLEVQKQLVAQQYNIGGLDGVFGETMENAVKSFQYDNGMKMTGVIDAATYKKIMNKDMPARLGTENISHIRRVITAAMGLQGIPYVFGGTSPNGFDCSGFVQYVFRQAGIELPRMADEQYYATQKTARPDIGHLVFFSTYLPGVSHVGIYVGNDNFIHASSSRGITISSLKESYWQNAYVGSGKIGA